MKIKMNKHQRKPKGQSKMDNPETQATLGAWHKMKTSKIRNTEN